ncbi:alpha/beta hydrolase [Spirosoma aerolatum]|uniref:alpha/beta hydrolase n=1 Tax=Spirosoma aerolatum TaxID=1211326 RepID=UPI0009ADC5C6|nr:alpha/beta hydrolase-fold protein [Spirosoma aerolatum]
MHKTQPMNWRSILPTGLLLFFVMATVPAQPVKQGALMTEKLTSTILHDNKIGLDPNRTIKVYLPPGYATSGKRYPVVYYFHSIFQNVEQFFRDGRVVGLLDRGMANRVSSEFIFVAADFSTPTTGSIFENSPVSGRWLDFTTDELLPFIDQKYRTIRHRDSRAIVGDFMGGRGALKLAMTRADLFSVVYALHPVATGIGYTPFPLVEVDWKKIHQANTFDDLGNDGRTKLFVTVCQAFLPNPNRPPFFCDFFMELENGVPKPQAERIIRGYQHGFLLEEELPEAVASLQSMRGIAFDWGRFDPTQSHVFSNQVFSRKLEEFGIEHEAEEYRGTPWNRVWTDDGRFYTRVLPFLQRHLVFDSPH